jgi:hypothetical protein
MKKAFRLINPSHVLFCHSRRETTLFKAIAISNLAGLQGSIPSIQPTSLPLSFFLPLGRTSLSATIRENPRIRVKVGVPLLEKGGGGGGERAFYCRGNRGNTCESAHVKAFPSLSSRTFIMSKWVSNERSPVFI